MRALHSALAFVLMSMIILCSGTTMKRSNDESHRLLVEDQRYIPVNMDRMPEKDVATPITVPIINPTTPGTSTPIVNPVPTPDVPYTSPIIGTPIPNLPPTTGGNPNLGGGSTSGQTWCIAKQGTSVTALQVALDYACGYGGADCSAIQPGGSCFNPDTILDHASYAFNSYYQGNPLSTSCDFGGTATITNSDPSSQNCQYPSSSSSATPSVPNTNNPYGTLTPVYGNVPPGTDSSYSGAVLMNKPQPLLVCALLMLITVKHL